MNFEFADELPKFNAPEYEDLIFSLKKGTCIFLGAGVSKLAGYKLWDELKIEMGKYYWEHRESLDKKSRLDYSMYQTLKKEPNNLTNLEVFDFLYAIDKQLFIQGIKKNFI